MTAVLEADEAEDGEKVESLLCGAVKVGDDDDHDDNDDLCLLYTSDAADG